MDKLSKTEEFNIIGILSEQNNKTSLKVEEYRYLIADNLHLDPYY